MKAKLKKYTIANQLKWRAEYLPHHLALCYLADGEVETERLTYQELHNHAIKIAAKLQSLDLKNKPVLMLYSSSLEFAKAFFGCIYAGSIAVPTYVPKSKPILQKIESIQQDCNAQVILTTQDLLRDEYLTSSKLADLRIIATDLITQENQIEGYTDYHGLSDDVIFIQYTSGSTSHPKGARVTNYNIMINQVMLQDVFELNGKSVGITWLPLFHDMGLIASLLNAIYVGYPIYIMPPAAFIRKPIRWLQCISKYKGTYTCAPNFAYDLCIKSITEEEIATLDLSSLRKVINAAEPIQPETIKAFTSKFASCGFREDAFTPAYGLAEATVFVTGKSDSVIKYVYLEKEALKNNRVVYSESPRNSTMMISCGKADYLCQLVKIINPTTLKVTTDEIGEICISGGHIVNGYLNKPDLNQEIFGFDIDSIKYLRTGDLGFIDKGGELYITGRIKDLIIINGSNYYPQDIELTAEKLLPSIRNNSIAAFSVEVNHKEHLVIVIEINRKMLTEFDFQKVGAEINRAVFTTNSLPAHEIIFIEASTLPKTTSGKLQRQACKKLYLGKELKIIATWRNLQAIDVLDALNAKPISSAISLLRLELVTCIKRFIINTLKISEDAISSESQFTAFNLDSIQMAGLSVELESIIKKVVPEKIFYECGTIHDLADMLIELQDQPVSLPEIKNPLRVVQHKSDRKIAIPNFIENLHKKII